MSKVSRTIIFSPCHANFPTHRVGDIPDRIRNLGLIDALTDHEMQVLFHEI
jgi:hypothetical protein